MAANSETSLSIKIIPADPDGLRIGAATSEKLGFYGLTTPIAKPSFTAAAVATTLSVSTTTALYGFGSTQANAIVSLVNDIRAQLVALGLVTT